MSAASVADGGDAEDLVEAAALLGWTKHCANELGKSKARRQA
eukprot:CAMPEP_0175291544 /NCGR_PEP_ID=MMETSP0093-20121207/56462_1 /TAXON_ID=311494 /ORGANISM="Alexandrium monilatum, Strain CCMP3105" /LENGTH=41 /DNA_ID= /DNA_START= /DNA_END= /DNA_ORIENTATION=